MEAIRIGKFELVQELGAGGMGVVYRARDTRLNREVALKLIRPERAGDEKARARFIREFRAAAALNHPGIATLYEAEETDDGRLYFAAELVEGEPLSKRLARGRLSVEECVDLGSQLATALGEAHARGIIHRDIKPDNLIITPDGRLKIVDFGLARLALPVSAATEDSATVSTGNLTQAGAFIGTPGYMSPEQASGAPVGVRTDVFSAGAVLYEMATGKAAFASDSIPDTLRRILSEDPPEADQVNPGLPPHLASTIRRALSKSPEARFASGRELAEELRSPRPGAQPAARRPSKAVRSYRRAAWLGGGLVVLLAAAALTLWISLRPTLAFGDRDRLLIADVDNHTGEEVFDLALKTALQADLEQSPYAIVYGKNQVAETLRLMRKEPTARVDEQLGRDICRFAGIKALVVPRILAAGDAYVLQAVLVDPITGRHVETLRVTTQGREQVLLTGVDELTRKVRSQLGESLASIEESDLPIIQHTTSSWEALQSLTLGYRRRQEQKYEEAKAFFERALEYDPQFMAAKGSLGLLLIQFLGDAENGKKLLLEAEKLAVDVSEQEQLMIRAVNREFVDGDLEGALREYELIADLYPDNLSAYQNQGMILYKLGRYAEAAEALEQAARLAPSSAIPLWPLTRLYIWTLRDPVAADAAARRLVTLVPDNSNALHLRAWTLVAQRRFAEAETAMREVLAVDPEHRYAVGNLPHLLLAQGKAAEAVTAYRESRRLVLAGKIPGTEYWSDMVLGLALEQAGDAEGARQSFEAATRAKLAEYRAEPDSPAEILELAMVHAASGQQEEARRRVRQALVKGVEDSADLRSLGSTYALLGDRDAALDALSRLIDAGFDDHYFLLIEPTLAALRDDPRLDALIDGESG